MNKEVTPMQQQQQKPAVSLQLRAKVNPNPKLTYLGKYPFMDMIHMVRVPVDEDGNEVIDQQASVVPAL
jgi:hypothetical protein